MRLGWAGVLAAAIALPAGAAKKDHGLVVPVKTSAGQDAGTVTFKEKKGKLEIKLALKGLPAGVHGIHVHENPVCDGPDFKTAGAHFDPISHQHTNITVGMDGTSKTRFSVENLSVGTGSPNDILRNSGTSIMIHEKADDMKSDPTGNAGNRIACGVISGPATP